MCASRGRSETKKIVMVAGRGEAGRGGAGRASRRCLSPCTPSPSHFFHLPLDGCKQISALHFSGPPPAPAPAGPATWRLLGLTRSGVELSLFTAVHCSSPCSHVHAQSFSPLCFADMLTDDEVADEWVAGDPNNNTNNAAAAKKPLKPPRPAARVPALARADSSSDEDFTYLVLTCSDCLDLFPTRLQLLLHRMDAHSERQPYQCPACMATFRTAELLAEHLRTHTPEEPHACPHCSARFSLKSHVRAHGRVMHPEQHLPQHRCSECEGAFQSAAGLASHMRCHAEAGLRGTPKPFACEVCHCRFRARSNLYRHTKKNHAGSAAKHRAKSI